MLLRLIFLHSAVAVAATSGPQIPIKDCVLAGPDFPPPVHLSESKSLVKAVGTFEGRLSNKSLALKPNNTAWGVALFSAKENKTLYEHFYTPKNIGVNKVDRDSVFRIASISKVFSVWSFLIEAGDCHFHEPITKYITELSNGPANEEDEALYDDINNVRWDDVTLGQLASHAAGIARDPSANDLAGEMSAEEAEQAFGLPVLDEDNVQHCDLKGGRLCSRKELINLLKAQHPLFAPQTSPAYSNIAYTLLGYAQEKIMGKALNETVQSGIIERLGMRHSSYERTPAHGVIPGKNATAVGWDKDLGGSAPSGSFYSSTADMVKAGQAMLQSQLLSPAETRRWMSPLIQTGYSTSAVGAPWEIRYLTDANQYMTEFYTKQGDLGTYHAGLALSPQHSLGLVVLTVTTPDTDSTAVRDNIFNSFGDIFAPMAESQARVEAINNFNGTYIDKTNNSSLTILVGADDDRPGLGVQTLVARGNEVIGSHSSLADKFKVGTWGQLYPSQLKTVKKTHDGTGTYDSRLGFRAVFFPEGPGGQLLDPCLAAWTALGAPTYGQVSADDWVFEMNEDGTVDSVDVRMWKLKLKRVEA